MSLRFRAYSTKIQLSKRGKYRNPWNSRAYFRGLIGFFAQHFVQSTLFAFFEPKSKRARSKVKSCIIDSIKLNNNNSWNGGKNQRWIRISRARFANSFCFFNAIPFCNEIEQNSPRRWTFLSFPRKKR